MNLIEPNLANACVANLEERSAALETERKEVIRQIRTKPEQFVCDWVADPSATLAAVLRICAQADGDEAEIGRLVRRTVYDVTVNTASTYNAENR